MKAYDEIPIRVYRESINRCTTIPLKDLVEELLSSSMPGHFNDEALKAQAVLIRTNIARQLPVYDGEGCTLYPDADLCDTGHCFGWAPAALHVSAHRDKKDRNRARIINAVQRTRGEIIVIDRKPVMAYCHECCGGATENSEDIIDNKVIYLRKVLCDHCRGSEGWGRERCLTLNELKEMLGIRADEFDAVKGSPIEGLMEDITRDDTGRIRSIKIGGRRLKGTDVKDLLGLDSTRFGWKPDVLGFMCRGKGHGLGMCQYGADAMARGGKSYRDIINYYFTGVDITCISTEKDMPLKGKSFVLDPGHGGDNDGNIGPMGLKEKDINLSIALSLEKLLSGAGAKVFMTRKKDEEVLLSERTRLANSIRPHFLISIHQNGFLSPCVSGTEIYYYCGDNEGKRLGLCIMDRLIEEAGALNKGVKAADFYILREAKVSSLQLELFHMTNPEEEQRLMDQCYRSDVARAVFNGIMSYFRCEHA